MNKEQQIAISHKNGAALIVAGAGTGKTTVIVERLLELVKAGIPKSKILCLTFTEKAAQEMLDRTAEKLKESYGVELNIFTFNGFGAAMLSEFAIEVGMSSKQQLIGDNGKVVLLREHLDELDLDYFAPISRPDGQLADIANYFSKLKQQLVKPELYLSYADSMPTDSEAERIDKRRHQELARAFKSYLAITRSQNIIDYDDQLYVLIELLESRPNILKLLKERFSHIMVDEFQDTNPMQSRLIDLLYGKTDDKIPGARSLVVVGDDDQSIYGWRGATLANILDFTNRYKNSTQITLIDNYRSTQSILDGAWRLIQHNNPNRLEAINKLDKRLVAKRGPGDPPNIYQFARLDAELNWIAEDIKKRIENGADPGSIAVLARSKKTVANIHEALDAREVEHTVSGVSESLYRHPAVATIIECLRCIVEEYNQTALYHTLGGALFSIDNQLLGKIGAEARATHTSLENIASSQNKSEITHTLTIIENWRKSAAFKNIRELAYDILIDSGYKKRLDTYVSDDPDQAYDAQVLGQWFNSLRDFEQVSSIPTALSYIQNLPALEAEGETIADDSINIVPNLPAVMTIHKSKGLEWSIVYIADCTQGSFPLVSRRNSLEVPDELSLISAADDHYAEERRLMYVASTRARDELIFTYSESHNGITKRKPSQFIHEFFGTEMQAKNTEANFHKLILNNTVTRNITAIGLPAKMKNNGKLHLTASQADDYLNCPLNFYYKHVLCMPEPPSSNTVIGSLFHEFLQNINTAKKEGRDLPPLKPMLKKLENEWPLVGFSSKSQRERSYNFSKNALKAMYERVCSDHTVPIEVEAPFNVVIPNSKLVLNGRIDVILPVDGGVEIRDYKTSSSVDTPERAKSRVASNNQLTIYAVAWRHKYGEDPIQVCLDFVQTGQIGIIKKRPTSLDTMESKLVQASEDILNGTFPPGSNHDFCIHPI